MCTRNRKISPTPLDLDYYCGCQDISLCIRDLRHVISGALWSWTLQYCQRKVSALIRSSADDLFSRTLFFELVTSGCVNTVAILGIFIMFLIYVDQDLEYLQQGCGRKAGSSAVHARVNMVGVGWLGGCWGCAPESKINWKWTRPIYFFLSLLLIFLSGLLWRLKKTVCLLHAK